MKHWLLLIFLFWLPVVTVKAQAVNEQVWMEYMLNYPFANSFNFENAFTYSTVLGEPKWRAYDYGATLEWSASSYFDIIGGALVSYTNQTNNYNTLELRPTIGTRLYFTPYKRIQTKLLLRVEQRNFKNLDTQEWTQQYRPRVRGEVVIPINRKSYFEDKLWYGLTDVEFLYKTDDVEERFANRFRWRIGAGYRFTYNLRIEFLYMLQQSRNTLEDDFESSDNIFRFRVKQYLRKTKPSSTEGTGN